MGETGRTKRKRREGRLCEQRQRERKRDNLRLGHPKTPQKLTTGGGDAGRERVGSATQVHDMWLIL